MLGAVSELIGGSLKYENDGLNTAEVTWREEATRLALVMVVSEMTHPVAWRSVEANLRQLQAAVASMEKDSPSFEDAFCRPSMIEAELTLWILNIGLLAARDSPCIDTEFFASRAVNVALYLQVDSFEKMFSLMAKFLHVCVMRQTCMTELVDRIAKAARFQKTRAACLGSGSSALIPVSLDFWSFEITNIGGRFRR